MRCFRCYGRGNILGMGCLTETCPLCLGTREIKDDVENVEKPSAESGTFSEPPRRGRKSKLIRDDIPTT